MHLLRQPTHRARRHDAGALRLAALAAGVSLLAACTRSSLRPPARSAQGRPPASLPRTRAERTGYRETSRYTDVVAFIDSLKAAGLAIATGSIGRTTEGREIPYVVASRPLAATPAEAHRLGRPVVYVQANIHAGEVEGKEALQALLRDLVAERRPNVLDSIVLVAVPIYNADGNEKLAPQAVNRVEQNGPELVGQRANAQGLDLNRDYVKAEAPETRASLAAFNAWDPDVFVDLHTTDGSYHGYALTYSPSLNPAAPLAGWTRDTLLPELRRRVRERRGYETFPYGNFSLEYGADVNTDTTKQGWYTYDHRPRFGTNYYGLRGRRGRVAVLSEAYSHDPFERRVQSTYAFVRELLSLLAERSGELAARERPRTHAAEVADGPRAGDSVPVRSALTPTPYVADVLAEDLARTGDSAQTEPGVPRGLRRTGHVRTLRIPVYDRFVPTLQRPLPMFYVVDTTQRDALALLRRHGVPLVALPGQSDVDVEVFVVDSVRHAERPFQGHHETSVGGHWRAERRLLPPGTLLVAPTVLAAYLLEPESDDGLVTWNVLDAALAPGAPYPVVRVLHDHR